MSWWAWMLVAAGAAVAAWSLFVGVLLIAGRREWAVALARFIPDCLVLVRRLLADERVRRRRKALLAAMLAYLALPFDLVPDFIPVAGQLDDVLVVGFVLRRLMRGAGGELVREHWPGPPESLELVLRWTTTA
jgi:uncharacterized membrane protein YkvA (DUF1232 family)